MQIAKNTVASIEYTLKDDSGNVIDTSEGHGPLAYVHGVGALVPGLESELEGRSAGDQLQVRVDPEQGYGERLEGMTHEVVRDDFPADADPQVGMQFQAESEEGSLVFTVVQIDGNKILLDANHPLAGVHLNFDVRVVEVRPASPDEIEHRHVHGPGGQHH